MEFSDDSAAAFQLVVCIYLEQDLKMLKIHSKVHMIDGICLFAKTACWHVIHHVLNQVACHNKLPFYNTNPT